MTMTPLRRRGAALAAALLSSAFVLTACGSNGDDSNGESSKGDNPASGYPVTVSTAYGDITLDKKPERIVVLGVSYVDILTSLGETPVAFDDDGYTRNGAAPDISNVPWLDGKVSSDRWDVDLSPDGEDMVSLEAIAAHDPDLVILSKFDLRDESAYESLSKVAPVYAPTHAAVDWEEIETEIGQLTGTTEEAKEQIASVEQTYADGREQLQGLQGKKYNIGTLISGEIQMAPWTFLSDLGLAPADNQPKGEDYPSLSMENADQLQADVVMLIPFDDTKDTFDADPRVADLPASDNGTLVYLPSNFYGAAARPGPANLAWIVDQLISLLQDTPLNQSGQ